MNMAFTPNAPRFHTLWQHTERKRIFAFRKEDWYSLNIADNASEKLVKLDLAQIQSLPFGDVLSDSDVIGSTAFAGHTKITLQIYRNDPKDEKPINVDKYTVWIGLPTYLNILEMIEVGSTDNDDNFSHYANDHVFLVKEEPGDDHWLKELPREVYALLSGEGG
jgi:hypothetical protein